MKMKNGHSILITFYIYFILFVDLAFARLSGSNEDLYKNADELSEESVSVDFLPRRILHADHDGEEAYSVLTLGGSVTWGSKLDDRRKAWPHKMEEIGKHRVVNKALRAMGSFYPALCLQSMLKHERIKEFDIVVLEFSINGAQAFDWLVKRIRARFPRAVIVYVHLYSLRSSIVDDLGKTPFDHGIFSHEESPHSVNNIEWKWKTSQSFMSKLAPQVEQSLKEYDITVYDFERPTSPKEVFPYFAQDWHHLSEEGHNKIAKDILEYADRLLGHMPHDNLQHHEARGTWGLGDHCDNWFSTGATILEYSGADMKSLPSVSLNNNHIINHPEENTGKYSLEFSDQGGTISLPNRGPRAPLFVHYMQGYQLYPTTEVTIWNRHFTLNPGVVENHYHTVKTTNIGFAETHPKNEIRIQPQDIHAQAPFRLVAVGYCGACYEEEIGGSLKDGR